MSFRMRRGLVIFLLVEVGRLWFHYCTLRGAQFPERSEFRASAPAPVSIDPHQMLHTTNLLKSQNSATRLLHNFFLKHKDSQTPP
jgi:hypothetical protein